MRSRIDPNIAAAKASEIVVAFLSSQTVPVEQLPNLVRQVRDALRDEESPRVESELGEELRRASPSPPVLAKPKDTTSEPADAVPAVPIDQSITRNFLVSLEDGKPYRSLRRHLMSKYKMTPDDYRRKWGLPPDYPMVAPSYSEERSLVAKRSGLGTKKLQASAQTKAARSGPAPRTAKGRG